MSATIDERVVKMEFDNKEFEKNVATSLSTLDKLKNALTFTKQKEEISTLAQAIDTTKFDGMAKSVDKIADRFSFLGTMIQNIKERISDELIDRGERLIKSLSIEQVSVGWEKYAQITQSVQTILAATREQGETMESVTEQIEKLSWFTDETSYSLTDMTDNIAKFTSNGIQLGAATTQMEGIAVAAALAGANTQEASHAMSGFSKAMGEGAMKRQHWQWIQTAHLDTVQFKQTLIDTAVELGTLKKVGDGLYETLEGNSVSISDFETAMKDAWITTDVMSNSLELFGAFSDQMYEVYKMTGQSASDVLKALEKFQNGTADINEIAKELGVSTTDASMIMEVLSQEALQLGNKAFRAAQEAKTFSEAIQSVKDAVSSGWEKSFRLIFGNYEEATKLWTNFANAMYDVFAEGGNVRNEILEIWRSLDGLDGRDVLIEALTNVFKALVGPLNAVREGLATLFPSDKEGMAKLLMDLTIKFRDFSESLLLSDEQLEKIKDVTIKVVNNIKKFFQGLKEGIYIISPLSDVLFALVDSVVRIAKAFGIFFSNLRDSKEAEDTSNRIETLHDNVQAFADILVNIIEKITAFNEELLTSDETLLVFKEVISKISSVLKIVFAVMKYGFDLLSPLSEVIFALMDSILRIIKAFGSLFKKLKGSKEVEVTADRVETINEKIKLFADNLVTAIEKFTDFTENLISDKMFEFISWVKDSIDRIKKFNEETGILTTTVKVLGTVIVAPFYLVYKLATAIAYFAQEAYKLPIVQTIISNVSTAISDFAKIAYDKFSYVVEYVKTVNPKQFFEDIKDRIGEAKGAIVDFFDKIAEKSGVFSSIKEEFDKAIENFKLLTGGVSAHTLYDELDTPMQDAEKSAFSLKDTLGLVIDKLKAFYSTIDTNKLIALVFSFTMLAMFLSVSKLVKSFTLLTDAATGAVNNFGGIGSSIKKTFDTISTTVKSFEKKEKVELLQVAEALGIVALAIAGLALMDSKYHDNLINAGIMLAVMGAALIIFVGALTAISKAAKKADSWKELLALDAAMVALSVSVLILSAAVKVLEGIDFVTAERNILIIAELAAIIGGLTVLITRFAGKGFKGFFAMIGMALILNQFAKALVTLSDADFTNAQENIKALMVIFGGLSVLALAASRIGVFSVIGMLLLILSVNKIIPPLQELIENMKFSEGLDRILKVLEDHKSIIIALGVLAMAMTFVSSKFGNGVKKFGTGVVLVAAAFLIVSKAITVIGSISEDKISKAMGVVAGVFGLFAVISLILGLTHGGKNAMRISAAIMLMSLCLYPIAGAIWLLGTMDEKKVIQGTGAVAALMLCFAVIVAAAGLAQTSKVSFGAIISIVAGIVLLTAEMIVLTLIPLDNIQNAAMALCGVILSLAAVMFAVGKAGGAKKSVVGEMIILAIMLGEVAYALYKLSEFDWHNMIGVAASIAIAMLGISLALSALDVTKISTWKRSWQIFGEILLILIPTVASLAALGYVANMVGWENLIASAIALDIFLIGITYTLDHLDVTKISTWKRSWQIFGELLLILIPAVAALAVLSYVTQDISWQNLIASAVALDIVFAGIMFSLDKFTPSGILKVIDSAKLFIELIAILVPVVAALWFLSNYGGEWDKMLSSALSIVIVVDGLGLLCAVLSKIGVSVGPAVKAALAVGLFIDILIALIGLMALGIGYIPDDVFRSIMLGLERMKYVMGKIGEMVGVFIGGIVGGAVEKVMESVGRGLELFSEHAKVFTNWVATVDEKVSNGAKNLAIALFYLTAGELVQALFTFASGPLASLGIKASFTMLGEGVKAFSEAVKDVNAEKVENAARAASAILSIKAPNAGGILGAIMGENSYVLFNKWTLGAFGEGIAAFATAVNGITSDSVQGGIAVAEAIFAIKPPNSGGILGAIMGENSYVLFNKWTLGAFGEGISTFANAVKSIKKEDVQGGIDVAEAIFAIKLPNNGGIISTFTGDNEIWKFNWFTLGEAGFGGGIASFARAVNGVTEEAAEGGLKIAKTLFELDPPKHGGFLSNFIGSNDLKTFNWLRLGKTGLGGGIRAFANQVNGISWQNCAGGVAVVRALCSVTPTSRDGSLLGLIAGGTYASLDADALGEKGIGGGVAAFASAIKDISEDDIAKANACGQILTTLDNIKPPKTGGLIGWAQEIVRGSDEKNYAALGNAFGWLGEAVNKFSSEATKVDPTKAQQAITNVVNIMQILNRVKSFDEKKITGFADAMNQAGGLGVKAFCDAFYNAEAQIDAAISSFASKVNKSIQNNQPSIDASTSTMSNGIINSYNQPFYDNAGLTYDASLQLPEMTEEGFIDYLNIDAAGYSQLTGNIGDIAGNSFIQELQDPEKLKETLASGKDYGLNFVDGMMSPESFDINSLTSGTSGTMEKVSGIVTGTLGNGFSSETAQQIMQDGAKTLGGAFTNMLDVNNPTSPFSLNNLTYLGQQVVNGFSVGLGDTHLVDQASWSLADRVMGDFKRDLRINSPSKATEELGMYLVEGLALGMTNNYGVAVDAANTLGDETFNALATSTDQINTYVSENLDLNPAVTPFLDMSGIEADANNINSLFEDSNGLTINSHLGAMTDMFGEMNTNSLMSNNQIVTSLQSLHEDVQNLQNVVGNLQVIMDSGSLVGAIAPNMDVALGQMAMYKRRGM